MQTILGKKTNIRILLDFFSGYNIIALLRIVIYIQEGATTMNYDKKIPLGQDKIQLIIKSFEDGEFEYTENFKEHPTVTQNGRGAAIWNNIHTQLVRNFSIKGFKTGKISRGSWKLIYLFDEESKYLYTFMRDSNFINLHKGKMEDKIYHYSNILSRLNGSLLGTYELQNQQISLFDSFAIDCDTDTKLESLLQDMVSEISDNIERYVLVLVDCKQGEVKSIESVIPIAYMNPMYREDWSKYISAEYSTESYHVEETLLADDAVKLYEMNADINLSLRMDNAKGKKAN